MRSNEQSYNATGEAVCLICKNPIPLFSSQVKLYCTRECLQAARKLKTRRWQNCNWCDKITTHKYCSKDCLYNGSYRDRKIKLNRDKDYRERKREIDRRYYRKTKERKTVMLPMWGGYGYIPTMPFNMPQLWLTPGLF